MEEPPAPKSTDEAGDGPENAMLIELEWKPNDGVDLPALLEAMIYDLGSPVSENEVPSQELTYHEPTENCEYRVEFETGECLVYDADLGWAIEENRD